MEDYLREYDKLLLKLQSTSFELEKEKERNKKSEAENAEIDEATALKATESSQLVTEIKKIKDLKEIVLQKTEEIEKEKHSSESKRDELRRQIEHLTSVDLKHVKKECEVQAKQIGNYERELEILQKKHGGSERAMKANSVIAY